MKYEISIIVPVYNASFYLEDAINSLINQTIFDKIEVIFVNDGSSDNSGDICGYYANKYNNFKVIHQKNMGVSAARNTGLSHVEGKYVTFMDSDDIIENDLYEKELKAITSGNYDILIIDFLKEHQDGTIKKYRTNFKKEWNDSQNAIIDYFKGIIGGQVVDKLFLYDKVKDIKFSTKYKIGEDMLFTYKAILKSNNIIMDTNISGYKYIIRNSSAMTGQFTKKYLDPIKISKEMYDDYKDNNMLENYAKAHLIHESCKVLEYIYIHKAEKEYYEYVKKIKKFIYKYKILEAYKYLIKKQFFGFLLIRFSPRLYLLVHKIMHIG